jgi:ribosomal protein S18 acetylase RimI-like enzyme
MLTLNFGRKIMDTIKVRDATFQDSQKLAKLMEQLGYPTSFAEMQERLNLISSNSDHRTLVAEIEGEIVGMVGVGIGYFYEKNGVYGRILALEVDERFRRRGIGKRLIQEAEKWFGDKRANTVVINSGYHRHQAHDFYRNVGYKDTGLRFIKELSCL